MQGFNDPPRAGFSRQNMLDLLGWTPGTGYDIGMEGLDVNNNPVTDLSSFLSADPGSKISRKCSDEIQGTIQFSTEYNHNWGIDRVRPYMLLYNSRFVPNGPARFDLGIYTVTTPGQPLGDTTPIYQVTGYDMIYLLTSVIGDTYSVGAGTLYFQAINAAIGLATNGMPFIANFDSTKSTSVLPNDRTWPLAGDSAGTRWLDVINALLAEINYRPLWVDQNGTFRSEPDIDPATRSIEFIFGAGDTKTSRQLDPNWLYHGIVSTDNRSLTRDTWNTPNRWKFIQSDLNFEPIEGSGQYTVNNFTVGPASQAAVGRVIQGPVQYLQASAQSDLVAQGDKIVDADVYPTETISFRSAVLPIAGHYDVVQLLDSTLPGDEKRKLIIQEWELPLFVKDDMTWTGIAAPPDVSYWSTGTVGAVNAQPPGGGRLGAAWDTPQQTGITYHPPTPNPPGIPEHNL